MKSVLHLCCKLFLVTMLALFTLPALPATATASGYVNFAVRGRLPSAPCPEGCSASVWGGAVTSHVQLLVGGAAYTATFQYGSLGVRGNMSYVDPQLAVCAAPRASGHGQLTLWGWVVGTIAGPVETGTVDWVELHLDFDYERVGNAAAVFVKGGSMTISYSLPYHSGSLTSSMPLGTGAAVIQFNPAFPTVCQRGGDGLFEMHSHLLLSNP